jgi:hypothetical protein
MKRNRLFKKPSRNFVTSRTRLLKKRIHQKSMHRRKQFALLHLDGIEEASAYFILSRFGCEFFCFILFSSLTKKI